ncbi:glycosyltransferase family 2 protein [Rodentibacter caecimuris]|uniref:glycosyltransferase family 2 protein n=1 Tax=Rodentibacter caecimuris TaxID=1796644 RepID=UPI00109448E7|nr:glycosyltransferase family 2 protein [Pasteurella caecimuris]MCR1837160.1 glycosyltransferase family 2 protein [Pasteurella caecimuris]MCU0106830.1 glycosyltransferase family 2 protein [Pasteurella caecimuris]TGY50185.1 glycosyltransferase family 2 protein [Pasteurella caecimuris]
MHKVLAVIPHYNHSGTICNVVKQFLDLGLHVLVVDDGSTVEQQATLQTLQNRQDVSVYFRSQNGGKGAAMKSGFKYAVEMGFDYVVQADADGQHDLADVKIMLEKMQKNPTALICGRPIYSDDAPKSRLYGRKITDFWNVIHTHSFDIKDGMCGFRLYPLKTLQNLLKNEPLGDRMDFDIEILIKAHWYQIPLIWVDTSVHYEQGGVSHFRAWADNWLISKMHTKLFFGMLARWFTGKPL